MVETRQQQQTHPNSSSSINERPMLWTHIVQSRRKGNNKKQIVSFNPTMIQRPVTDAEASQNAIHGTSPSGPIAVVRPFIKGMEQDSVFIDLTTVKDRGLLNKALLKFNESSNNSDFYEDFLGYSKQTRNYPEHGFLETMWLPTSQGRKTIIEEGITLEDGTFLKGFPSYPADATIVRLTMENLPYLPAIKLKEEMAKRLSCFGDVLDHGISRIDGIFHGEGYATINLTLANIADNECMASHTDGSACPGHKHLESLARVILWDHVEQRKVLLQRDKMPDFCRNCQSTDHCRADCPDYKKWVRCYHCNQTGHVAKNCSCNNSIATAPAKVRAIENPPSKQKARKGAKESSEVKKGTRTSGSGQSVKHGTDGDHLMTEVHSLPSIGQRLEHPKTPHTEEDDLMSDRPSTRGQENDDDELMTDEHLGDTGSEQTEIAIADAATGMGEQDTLLNNKPAISDADALMSIANDVKDVENQSPLSPRSPPLDPTLAILKIAKTATSSDISYLRQQAAAAAAAVTPQELNSKNSHNLNEKDNTSPGSTGQKLSPNH